MSFMERMPLTRKLALLVVVPLIGILFFLQTIVRQELTVREETSVLLEIAEISVAVSALVHELQKERGMSAGYLGSQGKKFATELPAHQTVTDKRITNLKALAANLDNSFTSSPIGAEFSQLLKGNISALDDIPKMRTGIKQLTTGLSQGIAFYTNLNASFLNLAAFISKHSTIGELGSAGSAYIAFLQAKERAGIERAVLANVFAQDRFTPALKNKFEELVVVQNVYLSVFKSVASETNIQFYDDTMSGSAIDETEKLRKIARENATSGGFNVDPTHWFSMQTKKINKLKQVEDQLSVDIREVAQTLKSGTTTQLVSYLTLAATIIGFILILAVVVARGILKTLGADPLELNRVIKAIAADDLNVDLKRDKPATGIFASAQVMQKNLRDRIEADREALQTNSRIKRALDTVEGNVLLSGADHKVIYMNHSMLPLLESAQSEIQKVIPGYSARDTIGMPVNHFFQCTGGANTSVEAVTTVIHRQLVYGSVTFDVTLSPVFDDSNERIGTVLEWTDRTLELNAQAEVQRVIDTACAGDLSGRINADQMTGFFSSLSGGVNQMLDAVDKLVGDMTRVMSAVAKGNLGQYVTSEYEGSYQKLKNDTNTTVEQLTRVINQLQSTSSLVKTGVSEITNGNSILNQRAEEQAASLQETSASMTEMTRTVKQNAENAKNANQLALNAREQAESGGAVVNRAVKAMLDIDSSSKEISDIIGVIDEIAFQTNLLALNASVEAARAGEHGRGFAVVASEVRNLAGRSANAAQEIKDIIQDSSVKVSDGSKLVNESGEMLQEIVTCVNRVTDIVGEISEASQDQSAGIEQVNGAITMMEELTQQNAALVEEATAASESLGKQATELDQLTSFFNGLKEVPSGNADSIAPEQERRKERRPWSDEQQSHKAA